MTSLVVAGFIIGIARAGLRQLRFILSRRFAYFKWLAPDASSIWARVNQKGTNQWAVVFLGNDIQYLGYVKYFRNDPDAIDQDFLLAESFRVDNKRRIIYSVDGVGVYLNTRDVRRIEFLDGFKLPVSSARTKRSNKRTT